MGDKYHPLTLTGVQQWFIDKWGSIKQGEKRRNIAATREVLLEVQEGSTEVVVFRSNESVGLQTLRQMLTRDFLSKAKECMGSAISSLTDNFDMFVSKRPDGKYEKLEEEAIRARIKGFIDHSIKTQELEEHLQKQPSKNKEDLSDVDVAFSKGMGSGSHECEELAPGNTEMKATAIDNVGISYFNPHTAKHLYVQHKEMGGKVYQKENGEYREVTAERGLKYVSCDSISLSRS